MLATSFEVLLRPWPMVVTGGVVMIIVLGVTLLGEGLRRQLQGELELRPSLLDRALNWTAGLLSRPDMANGSRTRTRWLWAAAILLAGAVIIGVALLNRPATPAPAGFSLVPPGGHAWATQRHDAYGTLAVPEPGPAAATELWRFEHTDGFAGAPVVGNDGTVYVVDRSGILLAIDAAGELRWQTSLGVTPVGTPAIGADGTLFIVDDAPGLSAVAADGTVQWRYTPAAEGRRATSGPIVGSDGTIYFSRVDRVQAVNPDGSERWLSAPVEGLWEEPPRLSPTYDLIFLGLGALSTQDGSTVDLQLPITQEMLFTGPRLAVGADGRHYLMAGNTALEWELVQGKAQVQPLHHMGRRRAQHLCPVRLGYLGGYLHVALLRPVVQYRADCVDRWQQPLADEHRSRAARHASRWHRSGRECLLCAAAWARRAASSSTAAPEPSAGMRRCRPVWAWPVEHWRPAGSTSAPPTAFWLRWATLPPAKVVMIVPDSAGQASIVERWCPALQ